MNLFRYKGVLAVNGMKKFVFQGVRMLFSATFVEDKKGETAVRHLTAAGLYPMPALPAVGQL